MDRVRKEQVDKAKQVDNLLLEDFYVEREIEKIINEFIKSDRLAMVIYGPSGTGKTTLVDYLVCRYSSEGHLCASIPLPYPLNMFENDFKKKLVQFDKIPEEVDFWPTVNRICASNKKCLIVFCDAVNEYNYRNENNGGKESTPTNLLETLNDIINVIGRACTPSKIKFIITSRPETWNAGKSKMVSSWLYGGAGKGYELNRYSDQEMRAAYKKYRDVYSIQTDIDDLPALTRSLLRDPLLLTLTCRVSQGGKIPDELNTADIFESYREHIVPKEISDARPQLAETNGLLEAMLVEMFETDKASHIIKTDTINYRELSASGKERLKELCVPYDSDSIGAYLKGRDVLRYSYDSENLGGVSFRFAYDRFAEYLFSTRLETHIQNLREDKRDNSSEILKVILDNLPRAQYMNTVFGALQQTLLAIRSQIPDYYSALLQKIARHNEHGLALVVSVLAKIAMLRPESGNSGGIKLVTTVLDESIRRIDGCRLFSWGAKLRRGRSVEAEPVFPIVDAVYRMLRDEHYQSWLKDGGQDIQKKHLPELYNLLSAHREADFPEIFDS